MFETGEAAQEAVKSLKQTISGHEVSLFTRIFSEQIAMFLSCLGSQKRVKCAGRYLYLGVIIVNCYLLLKIEHPSAKHCRQISFASLRF